MSDINSGLPIRTQLPGQSLYDDVITKMADGTTDSQLASVDTHGSQQFRVADAAGNVVTSVANGAVRALEVQTQSAGPVAPGTAAIFSSLVGGQFNSTPPTLSAGQQVALQVDANGRLLVDTSSSTPNDTNWGVVGASTLRTAAEIGNATGAADFNYGTVGAQTLRTASQIGNATGAADFNNGATGAQTLRVVANLSVGGANVTATNPIPVQLSSAPLGTPVNNYNTVAAVAAGATSNHIYTITGGKTFQGKKIWASASGLMKIEVRVSPDGTAYSTLWVGFNSTADPNITIDMDEMVFLESGAGSTIEVIRTNLDKQSMDVYSTISGTEV